MVVPALKIMTDADLQQRIRQLLEKAPIQGTTTAGLHSRLKKDGDNIPYSRLRAVLHDLYNRGEVHYHRKSPVVGEMFWSLKDVA